MHRNVVRQKKLGEVIDKLAKLEADLKKGDQSATLKDVRKAVKPVIGMVAGSADMMGQGMRIETHFLVQKSLLKDLIKQEGKVKAVQTYADWFGRVKDLGMGIAGGA